MPQLVTVEVEVESISIPTPPIDFGFRAIPLPSIPAIAIPGIDIRPTVFTVPVPVVGRQSIRLPTVNVGRDFIDLGRTPPFPVPDVELPRLNVETYELEILSFEFDVIDPFGTDLVGGRVGVDFAGPFDLGGASVPTVDVGSTTASVPSVSVTQDTITIPGFQQQFPTIGPFAFPDLSIPTDFRLTGSVSVPDPTSIDPNVSTNFDPLREEIFGAFPDGLLSDPLVWSFETAVSGFVSQIGTGVGTTVKNAINAFMEAAVNEETKESLKEKGRNRDS